MTVGAGTLEVAPPEVEIWMTTLDRATDALVAAMRELDLYLE